MGLTDSESKLHGQLIKGEQGINLPRLFGYYEGIVARRPELTINNYNLDYSFGRSKPKRFRFMEVATADLAKTDGVLLTRVGIHGEERYSVVAFALAFPEVAAYAKEKRVGLISWVAANPWGLTTWQRYNPEYNRLLKKGEPFTGNDDAIRYQLANGRWVSILNNRPRKVKWEWADRVAKRLPVESQFALDYTRELIGRGMLGEEKTGGGPRIKAVYDGHNDHITENEFEEVVDGLPAEAFYFYSFGQGRHFQKAVRQSEKIVPVVRSRKADSGDGGTAQVNRYGEAIKYQGSWIELMWRLGINYVVALETRQGNELWEDKEIVLIFLKHLIDLVAKGE